MERSFCDHTNKLCDHDLRRDEVLRLASASVRSFGVRLLSWDNNKDVIPFANGLIVAQFRINWWRGYIGYVTGGEFGEQS